jgi:hypothetical protein
MPFITASSHYIARGVYDFAVDGGAVSTIPLRGDSQLPSGVVITNSLIVVQTALTSGGGATVGVSSEGASDIAAAAAISGAPWSTTGAKRGTLNATATPITTTAARTISAVIGTAALTAGKFYVLVWYVTAQA